MSSVSAEAEVAHIGGWSLLRPRRWFANGQGRLVSVLATVLLALCHGFFGKLYWEPICQRVFDTYQSIAPRQVQAQPVVIVEIDEASVTALGRWPWPRTRLARLIEATHQLGARANQPALRQPGQGPRPILGSDCARDVRPRPCGRRRRQPQSRVLSHPGSVRRGG